MESKNVKLNPAMEVTINTLEACIANELVLGEKLLALLDKKKDSVISNDLSAIESLTSEENEALHQMEELGLERQETILQISKQPGYRITEKLGDFVAQLQDPVKKNLVEKRGMLMLLYEKIAKASKLNGELLAQSMEVTQHLFQRLSSVDRRVKNSNYQRFGAKSSGSSISSSISSKG